MLAPCLLQTIVHFNKQMAVNQQLRADIDHLRQEKSVFDSLYRKLASKLGKGKKQIISVIEASTQAFEQRWLNILCWFIKNIYFLNHWSFDAKHFLVVINACFKLLNASNSWLRGKGVNFQISIENNILKTAWPLINGIWYVHFPRTDTYWLKEHFHGYRPSHNYTTVLQTNFKALIATWAPKNWNIGPTWLSFSRGNLGYPVHVTGCTKKNHQSRGKWATALLCPG